MATKTDSTKPQSFRQFYAKKFNTYESNVCYWPELTGPQQQLARHKFSNVDMAGHVYQTGRYGAIICRRKLEADDD